MRIELTNFAKEELKSIYDYYESEVSERVALDIMSNLLDAIETIGSLPTIGSNEHYLSEMGLKHKYIVSGNYKIIFRKEKDVIYITDIFDGRRDPNKIIKRNK